MLSWSYFQLVYGMAVNVQKLLNRPQPLGSQAQLLSRLKSGSQTPPAIRPVGSKVAAGDRSQQLFCYLMPCRDPYIRFYLFGKENPKNCQSGQL